MPANILNAALLYVALACALAALGVPLALLVVAWRSNPKHFDSKRKTIPWRRFGGGGRID